MDFLATFISYLPFVLGHAAFTSVVNRDRSRCEHFVFWSIFFSVIAVSIVSFYSLIMTYAPIVWKDYLNLPFGLTVFLLVFLCQIVLYKANVKTVFFTSGIIFLGCFLADDLTKMVLVSLELADLGVPFYVSSGIAIVMQALVILFTYNIILKTIIGRIQQLASSLFITLTSIFLGISIFSFVLKIYVKSISNIFYLLVVIISLFYCIVMYSLYYAALREGQNDIEMLVLKQLWNEDQKHYQMQKENVDMINIKCHDLRHQIEDFRLKGDFTDKMIKDLEHSIQIYDSVFKTKNETLDVILSSVSLRCQKYGIELTAMADGSLLNHMEDVDIYSLFGNLLDNALEYEQSVPEEMRFISLTIKQENNKIHVHVENYYQGELKQVSLDSLSTTKEDKAEHGYGLKSIQRIVSKYNGKSDIIIADDMFQFDIFLPIKEVKQHE